MTQVIADKELSQEQETINRLAVAIAKAKRNLVAFRKIILSCGEDEVRPAEFHYRWSNDLLHGKKNKAIEGYRESAKTQYILRAYPLYALMFPDKDRDYIVLIKNNATLAKAKLKEIEREYESNPLLNANCVRVLEQSGEVFSVDVTDAQGIEYNVRIEAYGKGSSVRGLANIDRRPKICIMDDPQDLDDSKSETVLHSDWEWFLSDVMFLGQKTRIFLIGNNLGEKCIIERVINGKDDLDFEAERIPTITKDGLSAWPEKAGLEEILAEKKKFSNLGKIDVWLREKMCQAVGDENRIFNSKDYRTFSASMVHKIRVGCNMCATLDPASSHEKESCFRALVINAVDSDNKWNIVDIPFGRWDSSELLDVLFENVVRWKLRSIGIEKGMFHQVIEPFIYKEMSLRNVFFDITPLEHAKIGSKLERIKMLQPRFRSHNIWWPDNSPPWVVELMAELAGVTRYEIKSLFIDLVDALAMQEQIAQAPFRTTSVGAKNFRKAVSSKQIIGRR